MRPIERILCSRSGSSGLRVRAYGQQTDNSWALRGARESSGHLSCMILSVNLRFSLCFLYELIAK